LSSGRVDRLEFHRLTRSYHQLVVERVVPTEVVLVGVQGVLTVHGLFLVTQSVFSLADRCRSYGEKESL
jgi:hypothetical protein